MRIIGCILYEHNLWFVLMAALMCIAGSMVSATLFRKTITDKGEAWIHWCFLSAVTAGAATWATHFIAMLGYQTSAPVTLDGVLTVISALMAAGGIGIGLVLASSTSPRIASLAGGSTIGLAIGAMHYTGMFAYRVDGIVHWDWRYVMGSFAIAMGCSIAAIHLLRKNDTPYRTWQAGG
ncbi:MAG: MHYT domain-containing protein, partial [Pseudomonadota bacterium]|nr:MHYT domain-containing protein [Pseudomonadota bacterium]